MDATPNRTALLAARIHGAFLPLLATAYVLAGSAPQLGTAIRAAGLDLGPARVGLPSLLLGLLLFNAGLGADAARLWRGRRLGGVLAAGLLLNLAAPLAVILGASRSLALWHNPAEVQSILVGLALMASMPVAGSSTAWSQNGDGDIALSLGLVLGSTVLSPVTTPAVLDLVGWVAEGEYAGCLHRLAGGESSAFLAAFVLLPSVAGISVRLTVGRNTIERLKPHLKLANSLAVLALCYANASAALPRTFANPDWDFLAVVLVIVVAYSVAMFASGLALAAALGVGRGERTSLMFGLGMTNNGTGLALAGSLLADLPDVVLPVVVSNLVQHLAAGYFAQWAGRAGSPGAPA